MYIENCTLAMDNTSITGNSGAFIGGGMYITGTDVTLDSTITISGNSAVCGSAIYTDDSKRTITVNGASIEGNSVDALTPCIINVEGTYETATPMLIDISRDMNYKLGRDVLKYSDDLEEPDYKEIAKYQLEREIAKEFGLVNNLNDARVLELGHVYTVDYQFMANDENLILPQEVLDQLPAKQAIQKGLSAKIPAELHMEDVKTNDGVWSFKAWDKTEIPNVSSDVTFTGTWVFTKNTYSITYKFVSGTDSKEIPKEILALLPTNAGLYEYGVKVTALQPEQTEVNEDDGSWTFQGYDKAEISSITENSTFTGSWTFVQNASLINAIPVISAGDRTLTVEDTFNPLDGVTADAEDGDLTGKIEVLKNEVNTSKAGTYEVTYKVTDSKGASSTETIKVTVVKKAAADKPDTDKGKNSNTIVKTGDTSHVMLWETAAVISALGLLAVLIIKRKRME